MKLVKVKDARKCCFCLPLRRGLLAVGYFKLAIGIAFSILLGLFTAFVGFFSDTIDYFLAFIMFAHVMQIFGIIFDVLFIAGVHQKNAKFLRIYSFYLMVQFLYYLIGLIVFTTYISLEFTYSDGLVMIILGGTGIMLVLMALHIYFMYLVRSETRKLQQNILFSFKSHADEPECTAEILD